MRRGPGPHARSMGPVLAGLAALGTIGYFFARGISGPARIQSVDRADAGEQRSPKRGRQLATAAVGSNGADYGYTGYCGVERHDVKDVTDGFVPGSRQDSSVTALRA